MGIPYIKDPRLDAQHLLIYRALLRFEKLKVNYAGLYRTNLSHKDSLLMIRQQLADTSAVLLQQRQDVQLEKYNGWLYAQNAEKWKHKARKRNAKFLTLLGLVLSGFAYERIR